MRTYECFEISVSDGIAHLQLARPKQANSLTQSFWVEFPEALEKLNRTGQVKAMVISAQGKVFCGGLDLNMFSSAKAFHAVKPVEREAMQAIVEQMQYAITVLEKVRFPVIAAIQGVCLGAGFDLITACDICFATENAEFRIEETNVGMMADLGILQRLQRLIPAGIARYLALTGETLTAAEAYRLGLLTKVYSTPEQLLEHAFATAHRIAARPPIAITGIKRSMLYSRDHGVYESLDHTVLLQSAFLNGQDILTSIQARKSGEVAVFDHLLPLE